METGRRLRRKTKRWYHRCCGGRKDEKDGTERGDSRRKGKRRKSSTLGRRSRPETFANKLNDLILFGLPTSMVYVLALLPPLVRVPLVVARLKTSTTTKTTTRSKLGSRPSPRTRPRSRTDEDDEETRRGRTHDSSSD